MSQKTTAFTKALDPDYEAAMRDSSRSDANKDKKFFNSEVSNGDKQRLLSGD